MTYMLHVLWHVLSKDASFFTHYYSHNVYSVKKLNLEAKNAPVGAADNWTFFDGP
jgi:hypothetical protein